MPAYGRFRSQGLSLIPDACGGTIGPLGGVVAGLEWAERLGSEFVWLATFPADTPFLPLDLVATLARAASHNAAPIVASDGERTHSLCALWPITCAERLRRALAPGEMRSVRQVLAALDGAECLIPRPQAFLNINTLEDLVEAEALMREAGEDS
jgi:molybdopterin-guanine dinucleotide biosynthesis protein A